MAAFFMMMGLFAVKSVSVVIYSGSAFCGKGMIFPMKILPIAVNFCGAAVHGYTSLAHREKGGGTMVSSIMKEVSEDGEVKRDLYRK